jgi:ATP-binding cassette subfamily F protein 3
VWPGNYSAYALARELEEKRQRQLYVTQQKEIARLEEAIRRFKQWAHNTENERHARQARVKQRQIESMDKVEKPVLERRRIGLSFREGVRGGQKVVELRDVASPSGTSPS